VVSKTREAHHSAAARPVRPRPFQRLSRLSQRAPPSRRGDLVTASPDTLKTGPLPMGTDRKTAADRIPGHGMSEKPFDRGVRVPHVHRTISLHQSPDHGPLDHPIAEAERLRMLKLGPRAADLRQHSARIGLHTFIVADLVGLKAVLPSAWKPVRGGGVVGSGTRQPGRRAWRGGAGEIRSR
jgi:hypothetical protein